VATRWLKSLGFLSRLLCAHAMSCLPCPHPQIGELIGGSQREDNFDLLLQRYVFPARLASHVGTAAPRTQQAPVPTHPTHV
jgi:hypothetical protein